MKTTSWLVTKASIRDGGAPAPSLATPFHALCDALAINQGRGCESTDWAFELTTLKHWCEHEPG
jgi:hypothetical protein